MLRPTLLGRSDSRKMAGKDVVHTLTLESLCRLSWSQELESLYERLQAPIRAQQAAQEASHVAEASTRRISSPTSYDCGPDALHSCKLSVHIGHNKAAVQL